VPREREPGTWGAVVGFVVLYFAYVSAEVGVTSWSTEHLTPAYGLTFAAAMPGAYWGALTVGRLVAAALTARFAPGKVLLVGLSVAVAALVGATYVPIAPVMYGVVGFRSEEHTSELQSRENLVCRLLLEKKKANQHKLRKHQYSCPYFPLFHYRFEKRCRVLSKMTLDVSDGQSSTYALDVLY